MRSPTIRQEGKLSIHTYRCRGTQRSLDHCIDDSKQATNRGNHGLVFRGGSGLVGQLRDPARVLKHGRLTDREALMREVRRVCDGLIRKEVAERWPPLLSALHGVGASSKTGRIQMLLMLVMLRERSSRRCYWRLALLFRERLRAFRYRLSSRC
ncbi:unnamed protein product [Pylaiella littoralis]